MLGLSALGQLPLGGVPGNKIYAIEGGVAHIIVSGQPANLIQARLPSEAATGYITVSGQRAGLNAGRVVHADPGSVEVSGQGVEFVHAGAIKARHVSIRVSGKPTSGLRGLVTKAGTGSIKVTGKSAKIVQGHRLVARRGTITVTGQDSGLYHGRKVIAKVGRVKLRGYGISITNRTYILHAKCGFITYTGDHGEGTVLVRYKRHARPRAYSFGGFQASSRDGGPFKAHPQSFGAIRAKAVSGG